MNYMKRISMNVLQILRELQDEVNLVFQYFLLMGKTFIDFNSKLDFGLKSRDEWSLCIPPNVFRQKLLSHTSQLSSKLVCCPRGF